MPKPNFYNLVTQLAEFEPYKKDHEDFAVKLRNYFKELPAMSCEARISVTDNLCIAYGHIRLDIDKRNFFVSVKKAAEFKKMLLSLSEEKDD